MYLVSDDFLMSPYLQNTLYIHYTLYNTQDLFHLNIYFALYWGLDLPNDLFFGFSLDAEAFSARILFEKASLYLTSVAKFHRLPLSLSWILFVALRQSCSALCRPVRAVQQQLRQPWAKRRWSWESWSPKRLPRKVSSPRRITRPCGSHCKRRLTPSRLASMIWRANMRRPAQRYACMCVSASASLCLPTQTFLIPPKS